MGSGDDFLLTPGKSPALVVRSDAESQERGNPTPEEEGGSHGLQNMGAPGHGRGSLWKQKGFPKAITQISEIGMVPARSASFHPKGEGNVFLLPSGDSQQTRFYYKCYDAKQKLVLCLWNPLKFLTLRHLRGDFCRRLLPVIKHV